jgi:hypothetical protein
MEKYYLNKIQVLTFLFFINCLFLQTGDLYSQPLREWSSIYPETNIFSSRAAAMAVDDSGNVYTTGHSEGYNGTVSWNSYTTIKYNTSGIQQWIANFTGETSGGKFPHDIAVDKQGNVFVTGYAHRAASSFDFCTIKYNSSGIQQWLKYYDNPTHNEDQARKIAVDNTGNIYVSGFSDLCMFSCQIYTTLKYSCNGDLVWIKTYGPGTSSGTDIGDLKVDNNCNIYITGMNGYNVVTIKYDSSGNQLWVNTFSNSGQLSNALSITLDTENNVIITGQSPYGMNFASCFTIKYDNNGTQQWLKLMNPPSISNGNWKSACVGSDNINNIYISGVYFNNSSRKIFTVKYSSSGDSLWTYFNPDTATPRPTYLNIDRDNNIIIAGTIDIFQDPYHIGQILILKLDAAGILKWKEITNYPFISSEVTGIKIDSINNILLTGSSDAKMIVTKYSYPIGIKGIYNKISRVNRLYQNYPNPFNPSTQINYSIPDNGFVTLKAYDMLGREVKELVNDYKEAGNYNVTFDGFGLSSGLYFYKLSSGNYTDVKKMTLIK